MARMVAQNMKPGTPDKPKDLSASAAREWDRLTGELKASGIVLAKAHRALLTAAATIAADIAEAREVVETEGTYVLNEKTGATQAHPAAKRLDALRRDYIKVLSLLGLRSATSGDDGHTSLADMLAG